MKNIFQLVNDFDNREEIILRDYLALERTRLANERTLFSYIRTSLYLLTVGVGIFQIESIEHLIALAWICISFGILLLVIGIYRYNLLKKHLKKYLPQKNSPEEDTGISSNSDTFS